MNLKVKPNNLKSSNLKPLILTLFGIIFSGFILLTVNSFYFIQLDKNIEQRVQNQEHCLRLSEWIVYDLKQLESDFFRMATVISPETHRLYRQTMVERISQVRKFLTVIEKGGLAERGMALNLPTMDSIKIKLRYTPESRQRYNLEVITLRPKLIRLEQKIDELAGLLYERYTYIEAQDSKNRVVSIDNIKKNLKKFSPFFTRLSEPANQLFYQNSQRFEEVLTYSDDKHRQYHRLEFIFLGLIALLVLGLSFFLLRRAELSFRQLQREIKERRRLEQEYLRYQGNLEREVKERTLELVADIELRKEVEATLRQTSYELEVIFANSQVGFVLLKGERRIARLNQKMADIFGYETTSEMVGFSTEALHLCREKFIEFGELYYENLNSGKVLQIECQLKKKNGEAFWCRLSGKALDVELNPGLQGEVLWVLEDITKRKEAEIERERLLAELEKALEQVKTLAGIVPICMYCKKIRDDQGYWNQLEKFISEHSEAEFSHGICPECYEKAIADIDREREEIEQGKKDKLQ